MKRVVSAQVLLEPRQGFQPGERPFELQLALKLDTGQLQIVTSIDDRIDAIAGALELMARWLRHESESEEP